MSMRLLLFCVLTHTIGCGAGDSDGTEGSSNPVHYKRGPTALSDALVNDPHHVVAVAKYVRRNVAIVVDPFALPLG